MKRWLTGLLVLALTFAALPPAARAEGSGITVDGRELFFDVQPQVVDGVLMVPVRAVAEAMQGQITWDQPSRTATVAAGQRRVLLTAGSGTAQLDGRPVTLSGKVLLIGNRLFVPASFLLTFYGSRLRISHPAMLDPRAVELLLRSEEALPTHYDVVLKQHTVMTDGVNKIDNTLELTAKVRGNEMLLLSTTSGDIYPTGDGATSMAIRNGKQYQKVGGNWVELGNPSVAYYRRMLSLTGNARDTSRLSDLILEAHLGEARTVNGRAVQDLLITFDMNRLWATLPAPEAGGPSPAFFERYSMIFTIDTETGAQVAQRLELLMVIRDEGKEVRMQTDAEQSQTPSTEPITWPADLKN